MQARELLERFKSEAPIPVMVRSILEFVLSAQRLDDIFRRHAVRQKCGELLFSTVGDLMALVALKIKPSINAAYLHRTQEEVGVAIESIYNKLRGIEPAVSRALVRETATELRKVMETMPQGQSPPYFPGYETRILDGNHLAGTQHRIKELRTTGEAALPAVCLAILDPDRRLLVDVLPCENAHTSECRLLPQAMELIQANEIWITDRKLSTKEFMFTIQDRQAFFLFRHAKGLVSRWKELEKPRECGPCSTGKLSEQQIEIEWQGRAMTIRRVTVHLRKPTRKGEREVFILTNLPATMSAGQIADGYLKRWDIEIAFQQLATCLHSEIESLGYPQAALFSFCMAMTMFNVLSTIKLAIAAHAKSPELRDKLSTYHMALEVSDSWRGLRIALNDEEFQSLMDHSTAPEFGRALLMLAAHAKLQRYRKSVRGPKLPPPKRTSGKRGRHIATQKLIAARSTEPR